MRALLVLLLAVLSSCGVDAALLIIEVSDRPPEVRLLRATVALNDKTAMLKEIRTGLDQFGIYLDPGASGSFRLDIDGVDGDGCVVARGRTDTTLAGNNRVRLGLALTRLATRECGTPGK